MRSVKCFISAIAVLCLICVVLLLLDGKNSTELLTQRFSLYDTRMNIAHRGNPDLPCCKWDENLLVGRLKVDQSDVDLEKVRISDKSLSAVEQGGRWRPRECRAKTKVAIIVPVRHREKHLKVLLRHLHPVLQRQKLDYRVFVINQVDRYPFNKAKLLNVGFVESIKYDDYDCFVFHDVDLIPEDDRNDYGCPSGPRHMCPAVSKFDYKVKARGIKMVRPPMETGRYTMIVHKDEDRNSKAKQLLLNAAEYIDRDGLNTLRYKVKAKQLFNLYTQIEVNVEMTEDEKVLTSLKVKS